MNTKSYLIAALLALVLAGWMASGYLVRDSQGSVPEPAAAEPAVAPMTVAVSLQSAQQVRRRLEAQGEARANRRVTLRAQTAGRVASLEVERGRPVAADQPLLRLAMEDRRERLAQAEALVAQREADYQAAERLGRDGFQSESQRRQAFAALQAARAELAAIRQDIANTVIRAPFDGVLEERMVERGDYLRVGDSVAVVVDNDPLRVRVDIAQQQIRRLARGAQASIRLATGDNLTGTVSYISPRASDGTHTFPVEITAANPEGLPAGVSATVTLPLESQQAHFVSPALLSLASDGTVGVKTVGEDSTVRFHPVSILRTEPDGIWVTGLPAEARIIIQGQGFVREGERVRAAEAAATGLDGVPSAAAFPGGEG